MTKQQIKDLISAKIAGQGNQVDSSGSLATILDAIVDAMPQGQSKMRVTAFDGDYINKITINGVAYEGKKNCLVAIVEEIRKVGLNLSCQMDPANNPAGVDAGTISIATTMDDDITEIKFDGFSFVNDADGMLVE